MIDDAHLSQGLIRPCHDIANYGLVIKPAQSLVILCGVIFLYLNLANGFLIPSQGLESGQCHEILHTRSMLFTVSFVYLSIYMLWLRTVIP